MQVVVTQTESNKDKIRKLVDHCFCLDGTKIKIIPLTANDAQKFRPLYKDNIIGCKRSFIFHHAALAMKGEPFIYLRPISIPTKKNWVKTLEKEYKKDGIPILIDNEGIGVYPAEANWLVPVDLKEGHMTDWIFKHLAPVTKKIQLSFKPLESVKPKSIKSFLHTGDLGDSVAALPTIRTLGGGHIVISNHKRAGDGYFKPIKGAKYEALRPLLEAQPYIHSVSYEDNPKVDYDFSDFRIIEHRKTSLAHAQAKYMKVEIDTSPWLTCEPSSIGKGRVIVARSERYNSLLFPWDKVLAKYGNKLLFLGFTDEHKAFEKYTDSKVEYHKTKDLLDVAQIMKASSLVISNQTAAWWIAFGLGVPTIQETTSWMPNSIIERDNCQYVPGWDISLPDF